jgi:hypothetical protein
VEDGDDKIRRNLLVVSATVIVIWWLQLSPGELAERVVGVKGGPGVSAWRIWAAALALLTYLALRYRFNGSTRTAYRQMVERWHLGRTELGKEIVCASAVAFLEGRSKRCLVEIREPSTVDPIDEVFHDAPRTYTAEATGDDRWECGTVHFFVHVGRTLVRADSVHYELPAIHRVRASLQAGARVLAYSPSTVELLVPAAFCYAALWLCINQLASELLR